MAIEANNTDKNDENATNAMLDKIYAVVKQVAVTLAAMQGRNPQKSKVERRDSEQ